MKVRSKSLFRFKVPLVLVYVRLHIEGSSHQCYE